MKINPNTISLELLFIVRCWGVVEIDFESLTLKVRAAVQTVNARILTARTLRFTRKL